MRAIQILSIFGLLVASVVGCENQTDSVWPQKPTGPAVIAPSETNGAAAPQPTVKTDQPVRLVGDDVALGALTQRRQPEEPIEDTRGPVSLTNIQKSNLEEFTRKPGRETLSQKVNPGESQPAKVKPIKLAPLPPLPGEGDTANSKANTTSPASTGAVAIRTPRHMPLPPAPAARRVIPMGQEIVIAGATLQVNESHITVDEILDGLHPAFAKIPARLKGDAFRMQVAKILDQEIAYEIQQTLVFEESERLLEEGARQHVDKTMKDIERDMIAAVGGSRQKLEQQCIREGSTLDAMLKNQRRRMTVTTYLRSKFMPAIIINRRMLWDYYRKHPEDFSTEKKVQMQIIAAPYKKFLRQADSGDSEITPSLAPAAGPSAAERKLAAVTARKHLEMALKELQAGKSFDDVAKQYSKGPRSRKGGIWPLMTRGNKREKKVEEKAFALTSGEYSGIIEEDSGLYIVKVRAIVPGTQVPFAQAQKEIENKIRVEQFDKLRKEYFKKVYENATIVRPKSFMRLAVERAVEKYRPGQ